MKHRLAPLHALLGALLATLPSPAFATAPGTIAVEGVLSSTGGGPVADGGYDVVFSIWDKVKAGSALWSEKQKIVTKAGRFTAVLGEYKPIDAEVLVAKGGNWLGLAVGTEPELPRTALHSTLYARFAGAAGGLQCAGCVGATHIASGAVGGTKVGFNYAGSDTKGGSALKAKALSCTGCVTVAQLKFDQDVDLGARNLKTTGTIAAKQFLGDGSQLTGIKTPAGTCAKAGEVVKGIDASGQLICIKAMDPSALPSNGLNEISNQALSNEFNDVISGGQNKPIPDFNSNGLLDTITVPDIGNADSFEVYVEITKEPFDDNKPADGKPDWDTTDLTVMLFAPTTKALKSPRSNYVSNFTTKPMIDQKTYPHYVLHQQTGKGFLKLVATYPTKTKPVFGDIHKDWLGKNPKGTWQLLILDNQDRVDNKTGKDLKQDGKLVSWHIKMSTTSGNQVLASGQQFVGGKLWGKYNGHDKVQKGGTLGGTLQVGADLRVGGAVVLGSTGAACTTAIEGAVRKVTGVNGEVQVCKGGRWWPFALRVCPHGADVDGVCLAATGYGNQNFRDSALYCAGKHADMCTDSQVWVLDRSGMLDSNATWTNSFADNDGGRWSELNNGTGDDHRWTSGWQAPCCYNVTPPVRGEKEVKGVRLLYMHDTPRVYFRQAAMFCASLGGDLCSKGQYQVLRENAKASGMNTGWGYWSSDHSDNDSTSYHKGIGPVSDDPNFGQHWSFACCASHRLDIDSCPVARVGGVCAPVLKDSNSWTWSQAANACASQELELCSISEVAVLRNKGKFTTTGGKATRVWTESYSDCDGCSGTGTSMPSSGNNGPGYISVGPIGDDHPPSTRAGYACCL